MKLIENIFMMIIVIFLSMTALRVIQDVMGDYALIVALPVAWFIGKTAAFVQNKLDGTK